MKPKPVILIAVFCIRENQYIKSVPNDLTGELEQQLFEIDQGSSTKMEPGTMTFFHHLIVYRENQLDEHTVEYCVADCRIEFINDNGVLVSTGRTIKKFPKHILLYDKIIRPKLNYDKCYEMDRQKALQMMN